LAARELTGADSGPAVDALGRSALRRLKPRGLASAPPQAQIQRRIRGDCPMTSKLEALRAMSTVVADTGDMEAIRAFKPTDATTNPTLLLKATQMPVYAHLVDEAIQWGRRRAAPPGAVTDRLAVNFGTELTKIVSGRVSTEVDADLSF